jgi:hypothetical protein
MKKLLAVTLYFLLFLTIDVTPEGRGQHVIELMVHDFDDNGHETSVSGPTSYSWTFGDGQTATTASPLVSHDYSASIDFLADYSYFDVAVTATTAHGKAAARKIVPQTACATQPAEFGRPRTRIPS